jgi:hypothetical protein
MEHSMTKPVNDESRPVSQKKFGEPYLNAYFAHDGRPMYGNSGRLLESPDFSVMSHVRSEGQLPGFDRARKVPSTIKEHSNEEDFPAAAPSGKDR